jgi:hypothetical protein
MRSLGIACTPRYAYLAVAADGELEEADPERIEVAAQHEASAELLSMRDDARRALRQLDVQGVGLLMPEERPRKKPGYHDLMPRIALETMVRIAAVEEEIPIELLSRPTVRSRLGLPKSGPLKERADEAHKPVGRYWGEGRNLAALAALVAGREA